MLSRRTPIVIGLCWVSLGCRPSEPVASAPPPPKPEVGAVAAPSGSANPIEDYRQARYQEAIRGLAYDSGFVQRDQGWEEVLAEGAGGRDVAALLVEGESMLDQNMSVDAIRIFTRAILLDQGSVAAYQGLGHAFTGKGKTEKAIASMRTALRLDPSLVETHYQLAFAYVRADESKQAIESFGDVLELDPSHAKSHERLAMVHYFDGEYEASWKHLHAAEALGHKMPPQFQPLLEKRMADPAS